MKLCDAPTQEFNIFTLTMLTSSRMMMVKQKIIERHGRVENIQLYDKDPTSFKKEAAELEKKKEKERQEKLKKAAENGEEPENEEQEEEEELGPPPYKTFDNPSMTLHEIFGQYGVEMKRDLEDEENEEAKNARGVLFYDFTPYNSKDPILLSLMSAHTD